MTPSPEINEFDARVIQFITSVTPPPPVSPFHASVFAVSSWTPVHTTSVPAESYSHMRYTFAFGS